MIFFSHFLLLAFIVCPYTRLAAQVSDGDDNYKKMMQLSYTELDSLMYIEYYQSDYDKAIPYMQAGREKAKLEFGEQDSVFAEYTSILGSLYTYSGQYQDAESLYFQALKIWKKTVGEQHYSYSNTLNSLAYLYNSLGNYSKAEPLFLQVIAIDKIILGESDPSYAISLNNLATLYLSIGNYFKAETYYLQALAVLKKNQAELDPSYSTNLNNLAYLYKELGNYSKAEPLYIEALTIQKQILGEMHVSYGTSLSNLAGLYISTGDYMKAEPLFLQTSEIWKNTLGEQHPDYALSLNNLASLYKNKGAYSKAETYNLQALSIYKNTFGEFHPTYASCLNNLATLYEKMGNYDKAKKLLLQTLVIFRKSVGEQNPSYANSLNNLALLYEKKQQLDSAFYYCKLGILANAPTMDNSIYLQEPSTLDWGMLDTFHYNSKFHINSSFHALLSILQKQYDQSKNPNKLEIRYAVAQSAIRLNNRFRKEFITEGDKLHVLAENNKFVLSTIQTAINLGKADYPAAAFDFAEMDKGTLLLEASKTANAQQFGDLPDSLIQQEKSLQKKYSSLTAKLIEKRTNFEKDSLRKVLNNVNLEIDIFTKMLKEKFPKYTRLKYNNKTATAKEIQKSLEANTALLEYIIGDSVVYIFCVTKDQIKLTPFYVSNKILSDRIKTFHKTLSDYQLAVKEPSSSYQKYTTNASWFYENLIASSLKNTKKIQKLIIIPDAELGHLPFEAFLTKPAPQIKDAQQRLGKQTTYNALSYLFNNYSISYNYSATLWKEAKETVKNNHPPATKKVGQILAMASNYNIKIDTSTALSSKMDWRLPYEKDLRHLLLPLPAARKEIEILAEAFNGFFAFDKEASEKIFKEKAVDYAVIHLAMHGLLNNKTPILSSLAFTEDGDYLENNFLHAYEISKMKLNADLVVLSACETGYGRFEKGNGIASLAQAFAYAGAPAMIVSLWQVNDFATSKVMKNLYQNLAAGLKKDEALQQAKLQYINTVEGVLAHPAFWSPFIMMGNTDAIELKQKGGYFWWGIWVGIVALLGGGFWWLKHKK